MLNTNKNYTGANRLTTVMMLVISLFIIGQVHANEDLNILNLNQSSNDSINESEQKHFMRIKRFDIAENGSRFSFDAEPVDENGLPAYGGEFITQGYLYPYGFLETHNGVNVDGSPSYPEEVLGRWICRGWHIGEGASTVTGPWVVTTQIFDLKEKHGRQTIITEGYELSDINVGIDRAITGGTGKYGRASGTSTQKLLGFNSSYGVNVRVVLRLRR